MIRENANSMKSKGDSLLTNFLLTIITAGIIGCFGFLWNLNSAVARLQDHDIEKQNRIEDINTKMNTMQLNVQEVKERTIRIEATTKQNQNQNS